jgi:NAD(P)-dependent dehydrogenase (short-subunit alcohol dehydrogenase family)
MPTILVTGAGRGLGLEFVRQYAADGWRVHACCRTPETATALEALEGEIAIHRLDVRDQAQIGALKASLAGEPIDLLINNAGIYGPRGKAVAQISDAEWLEVLQVNAIAPVRIADALADNVAASGKKLMAFITSQMGSIARMSAGAHPYRMSKAALNAGVRCLSLELEARGVTCVLFHPGWVKTDMGGAGAAIEIKTSIDGMRAVIAKLKHSDNGRFFNYDGGEIPW